MTSGRGKAWRMAAHGRDQLEVMIFSLEREVSMSRINYDAYHEKLTRRRGEVIRTLEHVRKELAVVDENKEWIDKAAYKSRCELLDGLATWYLDETCRIDQALDRIREGGYGICLGCHQSIDPLRLETHPEACLCNSCQAQTDDL